jgi:hypothetical protein
MEIKKQRLQIMPEQHKKLKTGRMMISVTQPNHQEDRGGDRDLYQNLYQDLYQTNTEGHQKF